MEIYTKDAEILAKKGLPAFCHCPDNPLEIKSCGYCKYMAKKLKSKEKKKERMRKRLLFFYQICVN